MFFLLRRRFLMEYHLVTSTCVACVVGTTFNKSLGRPRSRYIFPVSSQEFYQILHLRKSLEKIFFFFTQNLTNPNKIIWFRIELSPRIFGLGKDLETYLFLIFSRSLNVSQSSLKQNGKLLLYIFDNSIKIFSCMFFFMI